MSCNHAVCEDYKKWTRETATGLLRGNEQESSEEASQQSRTEDNTPEISDELDHKDEEAEEETQVTPESRSVYSPSNSSDDDND